MIRRGVFDLTIKATIRRIGIKVKEMMVGTMGIRIDTANMFDMETITTKTHSTRVTMVT